MRSVWSHVGGVQVTISGAVKISRSLGCSKGLWVREGKVFEGFIANLVLL